MIFSSAHGFYTERARLAGVELQHIMCKTRVHYIFLFFFRLGVHGFRTHGFHTERARLGGLDFQHSTCKTRVHYMFIFFSFNQSTSSQIFTEEFQFKFEMKCKSPLLLKKKLFFNFILKLLLHSGY